MDLETENRIAAILMKEAAELHRQAEKEGVHAYLQQRKVRGRPNSRFLTATVLGVQQANRAAEISEMWRVRQQEINLDSKLKGNSEDESSGDQRCYSNSPRSTSSGHRHTSKNNDVLCSSRKRDVECYSHEDGLRDEEIEEFLHSRVKRGRGAVGSRMDEMGPYLPPLDSDSTNKLSDTRVREEWEDRIFGPEKPASLKLQRSSVDESNEDDWRKAKKDEMVSLKKPDSKKHKRKDEKHRHKERKERKRRHRSKSL